MAKMNEDKPTEQVLHLKTTELLAHFLSAELEKRLINSEKKSIGRDVLHPISTFFTSVDYFNHPLI